MPQKYNLMINYFGKLPFYSDFLKSENPSKTFLCLDNWFQKGIYMAKEHSIKHNFNEDYEKMPSYNFLFQPENQTKSVIGTVIPSRDKGARTFPFFIFFEESQISLKNISCTIAEINYILTNALQFSFNDFTGEDLHSFNDLFSKWIQTIKTNNGNKIIETFLNTPSNHFWGNLLGDFNNKKKYLITQNIIDTVSYLKTNSLPKSFPGLKFPLQGNKEEIFYQSLFWLKITSSIINTDKIIPTLFWNNKTPFFDPNFYIYFKEPSPKDFSFLLNPNKITDDSPCDMSSMRLGQIDKIVDEMDSELSLKLDNGDLPLGELIGFF